MDIRSIFEKVSRKIQISQPEFFSYYNDTIGELIDLYGERLTLGEGTRVEADNLDDSICVSELYSESIVDNIIALAGVSDDASARKNEFIRKSRNAYNREWSKVARNGKIISRRKRWF